MKYNSKHLVALLMLLTVIWSCQDTLDQVPYGALTEEGLINDKEGMEALLIQAYAELREYSDKTMGITSGARNWVQSIVASDNAVKGSTPGDLSDITEFEIYSVSPTSAFVADKWLILYEGINRCNTFIKALNISEVFTDQEKQEKLAEAKFLRGHFHFQAKVLWDNVPYIDENVEDEFNRTPNDKDIWPDIEADFKFAVDHLPPQQSEVGRANQGAAKAYLAKTYLFQKKYAEAKPLVESVINDYGYDLLPNFNDNFDARFDNSQESVFAVQSTVNDGSKATAANYDALLNNPTASNVSGNTIRPFQGCCGFQQPTQDLVNAYKTDANGLPLLDTFYEEDVTSDQNILTVEPFEPYTGTLDPRLDWTVGRRGIPYLDWGVHPGEQWTKRQNPYSPMKTNAIKANAALTEMGPAGAPLSSKNYNIIRFADVLLWAAEIEVEIGSLQKAMEYVNRIRNRAKMGRWVQTTNVDGIDDTRTNNAANYYIEEYTSFPNKEYGRKAVRFERRLELALEGHRYFDLIRWGIAKETLEAYAKRELEDAKGKQTYLDGVTFDENTDIRYPIPQVQIDLSLKDGEYLLKQNPGY